MNKKELIDILSEKAELSKTDATNAHNCFIEILTQTLQNGDSIALSGFGTLTVKHRPARKGRNPKTGETIDIAASNKVSFKESKALKEAVN